jgi:hypothetical protein
MSITVVTFTEFDAGLLENMWTECPSVRLFDLFSTS